MILDGAHIVSLSGRPLRKLLLSWIPWVRSPTRTALSSCNFWGIISLFGLQICRLVIKVRWHLLVLEGNFSTLFLLGGRNLLGTDICMGNKLTVLYMNICLFISLWISSHLWLSILKIISSQHNLKNASNNHTREIRL